MSDPRGAKAPAGTAQSIIGARKPPIPRQGNGPYGGLPHVYIPLPLGVLFSICMHRYLYIYKHCPVIFAIYLVIYMYMNTI